MDVVEVYCVVGDVGLGGEFGEWYEVLGCVC